jgi:hypothetical protein
MNLCFAHISICEAYIDFMLVSKPMFSGSMHPLRALLIILADLVTAAVLNFKMAVNKTSILAYLGLQVTEMIDVGGYTHVSKVT